MENKTNLDLFSELEWDDAPFLIKVGGTTYEVTTHFDPQGHKSVLEQFKALLMQAPMDDIA